MLTYLNESFHSVMRVTVQYVLPVIPITSTETTPYWSVLENWINIFYVHLTHLL